MKPCILATIIFFFAFTCLESCKKDEPSTSQNHNEFHSTVVFSSGDTVRINATGSKAKLWFGILLGEPSWVDGTSDSGEEVYVMTYGHAFQCQYRPHSNLSDYSTGEGFMSADTINGYMIGSFHAVCVNSQNDSASVSGTFKGNHFR